MKRVSVNMLNILRNAIRIRTNNYWLQYHTRYSWITITVPILDELEYPWVLWINFFPLTYIRNKAIWRNILLDAIEYFSAENSNHAVISINIAFESFTADHLYNKLITIGTDPIRARKRIMRIFDGKFSKVIKNDFPNIDGRSIYGDHLLFDKFKYVRKIRSHAIHSFTRRIKIEEAMSVLYDCMILIEWMDPTINLLNNFYKESYVIETMKPIHSDKQSDYKIELNWPLLNSNVFTYPEGITIDSKGNLYIVDQGNSVRKVDENGNNIKIWGEKGEIGIGVDSRKYIYVADHMNHRIQVFNNEGKFIFKWGKFGQKDGEFNRPHGLFIDKNDVIYVT